MSKPSVFVSCGQFTAAERKLGQDIVNIVRKTTGHEAFFAEQVHDFNGLRDNILQAIQGCVGFIRVYTRIGQPGGDSKSAASQSDLSGVMGRFSTIDLRSLWQLH